MSSSHGHPYSNPGYADSSTLPLRRQDADEHSASYTPQRQQQHPYAHQQQPYERRNSRYDEQPAYDGKQLYRDPYDNASSSSMMQYRSDSGYGQRSSPYDSALAPTISAQSTLVPTSYSYGGVSKPEHDYSTPHKPTSILQDASFTDGLTPRKKQRRVYKTALGDFSWRDLVKRKFWKYYALLLVLSVLVALATIYHDDIIKWLQPVSERIRDIPAGWTIWVGIMFVISFPPLFGHEVVCLLCGLIYGLWIGFAIVCLGTMLGEWGNFFVFKYWCSARAKKMEEKDITFACIARVIREGGFMIPFMARLSAIPGHLTTPAFAATGMGFWIFSITAFVTLPKQLMATYLGTVFGQEKPAGFTKQKAIEWAVLGTSFLVTIWAAWYIYAKMAKVRPIIVAEIESKQAAAEALADGTLPHVDRAQSPTAQTSLLHRASLRRQQQQIDDYAPRHSNPAINIEKPRNRWSTFGGQQQQTQATEMQAQDSSKQPFAMAGAEQAGFHDPARLAARAQDVHPYASPQGGSRYATPDGSPSVSEDDFVAGNRQQPSSDYAHLADRSPAPQSTPRNVQRSQSPLHMYEMQEVSTQPASGLYPGSTAPQFPQMVNSHERSAQSRRSEQRREATDATQYHTPQGSVDEDRYGHLHEAAFSRPSMDYATSNAQQPVRYQLRDG